MKELFKALFAKYNDASDSACSDLKAAVTGGLYLSRQVQNAAMPYMVVHHISGDVDHYCQGELGRDLIQFSIFDDDVNTAMDLYDKTCAAFDEADLDYDSNNAVIMWRQGQQGPVRDENVWMITVDYEILRDIS